jgi:hypothetical protein
LGSNLCNKLVKPDVKTAVTAASAAYMSWHPDIKVISSTGGNEKGATRVLSVPGGEITEKLKSSRKTQEKIFFSY